MDAIIIPHAVSAFLDRQSHVLQAILVVETNLPKESVDGSQTDARQAMLKAIAQEVQARNLDAYEIRWSSKARPAGMSGLEPPENSGRA